MHDTLSPKACESKDLIADIQAGKKDSYGGTATIPDMELQGETCENWDINIIVGPSDTRNSQLTH